MDFPKKLEEQFLGAKHWIYNRFHKHHHCCNMHEYESFTDHNHWLTMAKILPVELVEEIRQMGHKEYEYFLSGHFQFSKQIKELEHKMEILRLDIMEHCHLKESNYDKKMISESLEELKKLKHKIREMIVKEKESYMKMSEELEDKVHVKIQSFLKK
ncbi:MAG: hypothetical protein ACRCWI_02645 [Brevinema sp.]